jgi:eukaryotic-like serine/threonine-protein kinase
MIERQIFLAALDIPDLAARAAYLDAVCGDNLALRAGVDALLRSNESAGSFLMHPAARPLGPKLAETQQIGDEEAAEDRANLEQALTFLTPPGRSDSLGRIGHYEVLEILGRGGFGIVFRAYDEMLQRIVAVKVLSPQLATTSPARKRFLREARTSAQVRHENVVQVYEVGDQPLPYLVMELVPGESLQQLLDRVGPLDVLEVLQIGRQIAEGLSAAHATDLIHRDIKPGNVLLEGGHQKIKITDFGLARAADDASITQSGIVAGTPMYMAPEQAKGDRIDQRADLFSLGSVLYQMVAGRPPFRANSTVAVLKRVAEDTARPIREITPETPQWLCDIIAKLHAKSPDDRFQSAREVADLLAYCEQLCHRCDNRHCECHDTANLLAECTAQPDVDLKLKDFSRVPSSNCHAASHSGRRRWIVTAALLLPMIALAVLEATGVTHLLQGQQAKPSPFPPDRGLHAKARTPWNGWPAEAPPPAIAPFDAAQARAHQEAWAKYLGVPVEYTNSIGMTFRLIPPGEFTMGGTPEDILAALQHIDENEAVLRGHILGQGPQHAVRLTQPFYLGTHEVTQAEYELVTGANPSSFAPTGSSKEKVVNIDTTRFPVENVNWDEAAVFCAKLSQKEKLEPYYSLSGDSVQPMAGTGYRMPTEAEWEFACRAGTTTRYWSGDTEEDLDRCEWVATNSGGRTHQVGELPANPLGLYDVLGNLGEWVNDTMDPKDYEQWKDKVAINPVNSGPDWARCLRGGSYECLAIHATAALRSGNVRPYGSYNIGFRLALSVEGVKRMVLGQRPDAAPAPAVAPSTDTDSQRIDELPAAEPVGAVRKELRRRNPGSDGALIPTLGENAVLALKFSTDHVTEISSVHALSRLRRLEAQGSSPTAPGTLVDLATLKRMALCGLSVRNNQVADLTPLQGIPLETLSAQGNRVTELSPIKSLPIKKLQCDLQTDRTAAFLRSPRTLKPINDQPVAAFWAAFDASVTTPNR